MDTPEFYCYVLLDPRKPGKYDYGPKLRFNHEPFYVGKGKGYRSVSHLRTAKDLDDTSIKARKIRKILAAGLEVIIKESPTRTTELKAFKAERRLIRAIGRLTTKEGPLANLSEGGEGQSGYKHTAKTKRKIGANNKSHLSIGIPRPAKVRKKISETLTGRPSGTKGRPHDAEWNEKVAAAKRGIKLSEEHKAKLRGPRPCMRKPRLPEHIAAMKASNAARPTRTCPHCGTQGKTGAMTRYHFDNCKHR